MPFSAISALASTLATEVAGIPIVGSALSSGLGALGGAAGAAPSLIGAAEGAGGLAGTLGTLADVGLTSAAQGAMLPGLFGAATGALRGDPLGGLEQGLLGGAIGGVASPFLGQLGATGTLNQSLSGALGGAGSAAALGGDVGRAALMGAATPVIKGALSPATPSSAAVVGGGPTQGPAGAVAPSSIGPTSSDITLSQQYAAPGSPEGSTLTSSPVTSAGTVDKGAATGTLSDTTGITKTPTSLTSSGGAAAPTAGTTATDTNLTTTGAAPAAATTGGTQVASSDYLAGLTGGLNKMFQSNPLAAIALPMILAQGQGKLPYQGELAGQAAQLGQTGQLLQQEAMAGVLPPGEQAALDAQRAAAEANILSGAAARGGLGSSATQQELSATGMQEAAAQAALEQQLMAQGAQMMNMSTADYQALARAQQQQDMATQQALAALVGGLAGFGRNPYQQSPTGG
jgi:hypothetical protein